MADKIHKPHPKCECGRPLFKSFEKGGRVLKTDPYKFCRNGNCQHHGAEGIEKAPPPQAPRPKAQPEPTPQHPPVRARASRLKVKPKPKPKPKEAPGVDAARSRIRDLVKQATKGAPPAAVGLVLALVTQETGNKDAANLLIKEYRLEELFGLQAQ